MEILYWILGIIAAVAFILFIAGPNPGFRRFLKLALAITATVIGFFPYGISLFNTEGFISVFFFVMFAYIFTFLSPFLYGEYENPSAVWTEVSVSQDFWGDWSVREERKDSFGTWMWIILLISAICTALFESLGFLFNMWFNTTRGYGFVGLLLLIINSIPYIISLVRYIRDR